MKRAKKWMSLALAVVMTAGLMAVPAQAAYTLADFQPITLKGLYDRYDVVGEFQFGVAFVATYKNEYGEIDTFGLIDSNGKELVTPIAANKMHMLPRFSEEGIAMVETDISNIGYMDTTGKMVVPFGVYEGGSLQGFCEGLAAVQNGSEKWGYIDKNGKAVLPLIYNNAGNFSEGLAAVENNSGKWGYIDKNGKTVIPFKYDGADEFVGGYAWVSVHTSDETSGQGKILYGIVDKSGNEVVAPTVDDIGDVFDMQQDLVEKAGRSEYVPLTVNGVEYWFYNGYAIDGTQVVSDSIWISYKDFYYINQKGETITSTTYDAAKNFSHGFAVVMKNDGYGLIDTSGNEVIPLEYQWITSFNSSRTAIANAKNGDVIILTAPPTVESFTDVSATAYYREAVKWAVDKKITSGTSATTFSPEATCSNGQILTFLWRANGQPEPTIANPFTDVKTSDYYYKAALWASEKGLIAGTKLGADAPCTRSMVVTYLWKLAGQPEATQATSFTDVSSSAEYAVAVAWAVEQGITGGTSATTFTPDGICTRGQIVTFLFRAMGK